MIVGHDVHEDMVAAQFGVDTFLLTDCVINPEGVPDEQWSHGDFAALQYYLKIHAALEELKPQLTTLNHIKYNFDVLERDYLP